MIRYSKLSQALGSSLMLPYLGQVIARQHAEMPNLRLSAAMPHLVSWAHWSATWQLQLLSNVRQVDQMTTCAKGLVWGRGELSCTSFRSGHVRQSRRTFNRVRELLVTVTAHSASPPPSPRKPAMWRTALDPLQDRISGTGVLFEGPGPWPDPCWRLAQARRPEGGLTVWFVESRFLSYLPCALTLAWRVSLALCPAAVSQPAECQPASTCLVMVSMG